jgi:aryl-alcohol dehydrogenase-like predicted oxidoreductase
VKRIVLGRSGFEVSNMGVGAGGPSRIGQSTHGSESESVRVVREAIDLGMTFVDTAEAYRTEPIVGQALAEHPDRNGVVISTKFSPEKEGVLRDPEEVEVALDASLARLHRERIEVYHAHGVTPELYPEVRDRLYPVLERMKEKGKIGSIGITERFGADSGHRMLDLALADDLWDVIMVGFNMLNPSGRPLLERAMRQNVGVLDMFAVRRAFRKLDELAAYLEKMRQDGLVDGEALERFNPFKEALDTGICRSLAEMAYRFCLHEPGIDVVLTGTGSVEHLRENRKAADGPPLPGRLLETLRTLFGSVDSVSGN